MRQVFEMAESEERGSWGWLPLSDRTLDPNTAGLGVAHDVLEHFTLRHSAEFEAEAFGAMLFIRGETGWFSGRVRYSEVWSVMAHDIGYFLENHYSRGELLAAPDNDEAPLDESVEANIKEITDRSVRALQRDITYMDSENGMHWREVARTRRNLRHWLRRGYRRAQELYGDRQYQVCDVFNEIEREVDELWATRQAGPDYAGLQMVVEVDEDTLVHRVLVDELEEEFA